MSKILILLRGLPGSGKSTAAHSLFPEALHLEADMFFYSSDGEYRFNPALLSIAHEWCRSKTQEAMRENRSRIVVSNTFTQEWELEAYFEIAKEFGYDVVSMIVENRHEGKNIHGVPDEKLEIMMKRFSIKLR